MITFIVGALAFGFGIILGFVVGSATQDDSDLDSWLI